MKYFITLLLLIFISSCTAPQQHEKNSTTNTPTSEHKLARYFQESKKINSSTTIEQLVQKALQNVNDTEPLYSLGYLHMQNGVQTKNSEELALAEVYLKEVLTQFPGNQSVLQALYNVYYDNTLRDRSPDAYEKAKTIFKQLAESSHADMNPPSLAKYGATIVQQEKDKQPNRQALRELLLQAIQESPQSDTAYIHLANIYSEDRYFSLAIATLKLGAENIPQSAELYKAIANTYIKRAEVNGCSYEHPTDIRNASKYYLLAVPLNPEDQALHYDLSQTFFDQNLNQLALNEAQIALDIKASAASIGINAQNFSTLGYHAKALALMQQAVGQGYKLSDVGYHEIYMNQGDWKNAAAGFSSYLKSRNKLSVYDLIKSDIISQQANIQPWPISTKITISNTWEQSLYNYWAARISADDLKKQAHTRCEKTEYYFYTGYKDLQAGQTAQAKNKFNTTLAQNTYRFIERPLARYFLQKD